MAILFSWLSKQKMLNPLVPETLLEECEVEGGHSGYRLLAWQKYYEQNPFIG